MKKILFALISISILSTFNACKKSSSTPANTASVMFVNGCAGTNNIDVSINGAKLAAASNLAFLKGSGYQPVKAGATVNIAFALTATGTPLVSDNEIFSTGLHYSSFTGGLVTGTSTSTVVTLDDLTPPASGMAKVRFINLSADNLNTSCYIGVGTPRLDSNVGYKSCTPFFEVTPTTAGIAMIDQTIPTKKGEIASQPIVAGRIYTFMLTGTSTGTLTSALTLTVINNN